jgi:hypothetical protein
MAEMQMMNAKTTETEITCDGRRGAEWARIPSFVSLTITWQKPGFQSLSATIQKRYLLLSFGRKRLDVNCAAIRTRINETPADLRNGAEVISTGMKQS